MPLWLASFAIAAEPAPLDMAAFRPPPGASAPAGSLSGTLVLPPDQPLAIEILRDDDGLAADPARKLAQLPAFRADYVQAGEAMLPLQRGLQLTDHPHWNLVLEPGRVWRDPASGDEVLSLPFALQEKEANCTHNGVLRLQRRGPTAARGMASVLIASETCQYLKFNLSGQLAAAFSEHPVNGAAAVAAAHRQQLARRLPVRPLASLARQHPGVDLAALAGAGRVPLSDLSAWGLVLGDIHYASPCPTRRGDYPFCDALSLPSYSLAKSLVAGLGLMRLEHRYPGTRLRHVGNLVPECAAGGWEDVSLEQLLDMRSGHYGTATAKMDEGSAAMREGFFAPRDHRGKIRFACLGWPRREAPGATFVYHSSDSYLLGTAMTTVLRERDGPGADLYDDLLRPLWDTLGLSPGLGTTLRTADARRQPFTGYGLTLLRDDIARLGQALNRDTLAGELDPAMLRRALQRDPPPAGQQPAEGDLYYRHGFWAYDAGRQLGCERPLRVPFLSGYGGITVLLLPNDMVYYAVSDSGIYTFSAALAQAHALRPLCAAGREHNHSTGTPT